MRDYNLQDAILKCDNQIPSQHDFMRKLNNKEFMVRKQIKGMTNSVKAIPEGYHSITPALIVKDGKEAIDFYKKAFGAEERYRMEAPNGKLGHAELKIGDSIFMLADEFPEMKCLSPKSIGGSPVSMYLYVEDVDKVFDRAVSAGSAVLDPVKDQFWGDRHGRLADPFGHVWSISTHKKDLSPDELKKAAEAAFSEMASKVKEQ